MSKRRSRRFQNPGTVPNEAKFYDWNFGISKVFASTNAMLGLVFENDREETNSTFSPVNSVYTPLLEMSISEPLLQISAGNSPPSTSAWRNRRSAPRNGLTSRRSTILFSILATTIGA